MGIDNIWVFAQAANGEPTTGTLELITKARELLHMNPGACGKQGFHRIRTMLRFTIDGKKIDNLEVIELGTR